ncbi:hypothetical protein CAPTEDRAFT_202999 [Capitella teleta]|uniref:G-protein coupled receptors family 1 profile domain-containing protein n=1 Tax=Capitella teleta TaxID=283909 RepID=R7TML4_CAPTE|nr:hypothetical protein CAPTEDRAFT_202999 [Capitella teleta]|eukprot:ELT95113.1 hypothetical protein CAPTEDRAFT_202999 [Capitella teleta]
MEITEAAASTYLPELISAVTYNPLDWYHWALLHIEVATIAGFVLNGVVIVAFMKTNLLLDERPAFQLIFNLALSDFCSALFVQPYVVFVFTEAGQQIVQDQKYACILAVASTVLVVDSSMVAIFMMTCERLLAVLFPLYHLRVVTKKHCKVAIILSWLWIFGKNITIFIWNDRKSGELCTTPNVMTEVYYNYIFSPIQYGSLVMIALGNFLMLIRVLTSRGQLQKAKQKQKNGQSRMVKMVLVIVASLYLCWIPFMVSSNVVGYFVNRGVLPPKWLMIVYDFTRGMPLYNTFLNPLIYIWQIHKCREAIMKFSKTADPDMPGEAENRQTHAYRGINCPGFNNNYCN